MPSDALRDTGPDDPAIIIYTGTTGKPKGALHGTGSDWPPAGGRDQPRSAGQAGDVL
ncbi:hypothetical protein [Antarctobacter sp.]|uniref:hypothetical protein n=1 Tax=Antarctobacter sp. TaxID=1872577 RepID=UPI003A920835